MAAPLEALERAESGLAATSRRMLVIVNPYATTVSDRLKNLVVYALRARYEIEAVDTRRPGHATELGREAAREGYDVVVAFGGDGTVNEAANGLAGSGTALTCLPGGSTNVFCRLLGIPTDVVDATEHLLALADRWSPRRVDLGRVNGRHFTFASGVGLDASVVRRVDAHPRLKAHRPELYFTYAAVTTYARRYLTHPPRIEVEVGGRRHEGVTAVVQNAETFTYFRRRPVEVAPGASLQSGSLSGAVLTRASPVDVPTLLWRALARRAPLHDHRRVAAFAGARTLAIRSVDERPVPLEVDGDYVADVDEARYDVTPRALSVIA